jgi:hypothetical protein
MLSKCANPECSETFRYLHEGKIFYLAPTPDIQIAMGMHHPALQERFWLCARCSTRMKLVWGGTQVRLAPLPERKPALSSALAATAIGGTRLRWRVVSAGQEDR